MISKIESLQVHQFNSLIQHHFELVRTEVYKLPYEASVFLAPCRPDRAQISLSLAACASPAFDEIAYSDTSGRLTAETPIAESDMHGAGRS